MAHVWEKSYPAGVNWGEPLPPPVPVESFLETAVERWPEKTALDCSNQRLTYREVEERKLAAKDLL
jgi:long-chain acyl-CoA synthetase